MTTVIDLKAKQQVESMRSFPSATTVSQPALLAKEVLSTSATQPKAEAMQGRAVKWSGGVGYLWLDLSGIPRNGAGFVGRVMHQPVDPSVGLSGISGSVMVVTGADATAKGVEMYQQAQKINDNIGIFSGAVLTLRGCVETVIGFIATPMRSLSFAATLSSAKSMAVASKSLFAVGNGLGGVMYALLMVPFAVDGIRAYKFSKGFDKAISSEETFAPKWLKMRNYLKQQLQLTEDDRASLGRDLLENSKRLEKALSEPKVSAIEEMENLSEEDLRAIEKIADGFYIRDGLKRGLTPSACVENREKIVQQLKRDFALRIAQKHADVKRAVGESAYEKAKGYIELNPLEQSQKCEEVSETLVKGSRFTKILAVVLVVGCTVGIIAAILAMPFGGPAIIGIIAMGLFFFCSLYWFAVDAYFVYLSFVEDHPGKWDKFLLALMSLVFLASVLAVIIFSGGLAGFLIGAGIGVAWLVFSGIIAYNVKKKEQAAKERKNLGKALP